MDRQDNKLLQMNLYKLYCSVINPDFNIDTLSPTEKEKLVEAVADELIVKNGNTFQPNFIIMNPEQLENLQKLVFAPLAEIIEPKLYELASIIEGFHRANMPKINRGYLDYYTYVDLWRFGIYTLMFAAEDKKIWLPETPEQGVPLTLILT